MGNLFSFISNPFESLIGAITLLVGSAGVAVIVFTIIVRLILSPLQIIQLKSARAMQRLQPLIAELRKKHGKDKQKLTEETMKLYKEHKVNPAMGCLPMLLQFPVLIGLFWALRALGDTPTWPGKAVLTAGQARRTIQHFKGCLQPLPVKVTQFTSPSCWDRINGKHAGYWLTHIYHASLFKGVLFGSVSQASKLYDLFHASFLWLDKGLGQPDPVLILPILAGVTQWIQSRLMMQKSSDPQQQSMNMLMNFTPLIIVFFAWHYPAGLSLYWVTSTTIGILITVWITGWGSLPRFDRMIMGQRAPGAALVNNRARTRPAPTPKAIANGSSQDGGADVMGSDTDADITSNEDGSGLSANGSRSRTNGRTPRRRPNRPRGGRRG